MPAFEGSGQSPGLEIWRIEVRERKHAKSGRGTAETFQGQFKFPPQDFEAVPYPKSKYGKFHVGDSYIVLKVHGGVDYSVL